MIKLICSDSEGLYKESDVGIFVDTDISWVRDYKYVRGVMQKVPVIKLNPNVKYQEILGFGGAFTDASCYLISTMDDEKKESFLKEMYSPDQMNFNVGRVAVAQCDFGRVVYSYDETPDDLEMKDFSIDYDRDWIIPTIKRAVEINPELFLLSSPWSPPGWMKTSELMTGGWMRQKYLKTFASYYTKYIQEYEKEGISIKAITTQNESETDQRSLMPACFWHPEMEMEFLRDHLLPQLKENDLAHIELWLMDHNYVMWRRAKWMLDDPTLKNVVHGVAYHPYEGDSSVMTQMHDLHPEIDAHMTELGSRFGTSAESICSDVNGFIDMLSNYSKSIFCWNIALDENSEPNIGPFISKPGTGGGMVRIDSKTSELTKGSQYYALGHFSKYIKRGALRIKSECIFEGITSIAFKNPDGDYVVVITNLGETTDMSVDIDGQYAQIKIPENSVCTLLID